MNSHVPANSVLVAQYLAARYNVTAAEAVGLLKAHKDILDSGVRGGSFVYYVGGKIAAAAGLEIRPGYDEDDEDDEDEGGGEDE
jgi:hypothetical protein